MFSITSVCLSIHRRGPKFEQVYVIGGGEIPVLLGGGRGGRGNEPLHLLATESLSCNVLKKQGSSTRI